MSKRDRLPGRLLSPHTAPPSSMIFLEVGDLLVGQLEVPVAGEENERRLDREQCASLDRSSGSASGSASMRSRDHLRIDVEQIRQAAAGDLAAGADSHGRIPVAALILGEIGRELEGAAPCLTPLPLSLLARHALVNCLDAPWRWPWGCC